MKIEYANRVKQCAYDLGYDVSLRAAYSGRGMYGGSTAALVGDYNQIMAAAVAAAYHMGAAGENPEDFISTIKNLARDSMGRDDHVVY